MSDQKKNLSTMPDRPPALEAEPLTRIGPYRIAEPIGAGGMGTVYRAYDERLERPVALKQVRPEAKWDPTLGQRLLREARTTAQLSHQNIVQVFDIIERGESHWIVMELVEGNTLQELLSVERLAIPQVISLALDIATGLATAHTQGIVHRDLKSENIIVTPAGQAKILDFGVAKLQGFRDPSTSKAGYIVGTPRAMSPEQASGKEVDHRSDLFSFGVLLYEAVTGTSPFRSAAGIAITLDQIRSHLQDPACELNPQVPTALSELIDQLLKKEASHRPQTAEEVVEVLRNISSTAARPLTILFVDDEPDFERLIRQKYRKQIRAGEVHLAFAQNGLQAIELLHHNEDIGLIMSDINMPEMNGLELLEETQRLDRHLLTVMISAYGDMKNIRMAMNLGAFDFLTKPIDFDDLERTRRKATNEFARLRERRQLREENRFLHERIGFLRDAFNRYMTGDSKIRNLLGPVLDGKREVTVLKAEIEEFDSLASRLPAGDLYTLINRFFTTFLNHILRHQGTLHEFDHGKITVIFGLPLPRESDVQNAVDCARAMKASTQSISEQYPPGNAPPITLKVGIDSGDVTIESIEASENEEPRYELQGTPLARASEIKAHSTAGQILVSDTTRFYRAFDESDVDYFNVERAMEESSSH